jgi:hypothetical protein
MTRVRNLMPVLVLVLVSAFIVAQALGGDAPPRRRGGGMGRDSLLGLLRIEQVQKELKLSEDDLAKVKKVNEDISAEMTKEATEIRKIEDQAERRTKMTELAAKLDKKAEEQLGSALSKEQMARLGQIRVQARGTVASLANKSVAEKLKLTEDQQKKVADLAKEMQTKRTEMFSNLRDATPEQRTEAMKKYRELSAETDKKALEVLTDEQKKAFEEMKGAKFEMPAPTRRPAPATT